MKAQTLTLNIILIFVVSIFFTSCKKETGCTDPTALNYNPDAEEDCCCAYQQAEARYSATFNMKHLFNGKELEMNTVNKPYTTSLGQDINISKLRYLISDITFHQLNGKSFTIDDYHLVDLDFPSTLTYTPSTKVPEGNYSAISFTFGFDNKDNISGEYPDLNDVNWSWPEMMGGGYHYMQLEGVYDSVGVEKPFAMHMGPAQDKSATPALVDNNHFIAEPPNSSVLVNDDIHLTILMNLDQWFENPYKWNLNDYSVDLMGNYEAQKKLNLNGLSVFSIEE